MAPVSGSKARLLSLRERYVAHEDAVERFSYIVYSALSMADDLKSDVEESHYNLKYVGDTAELIDHAESLQRVIQKFFEKQGKPVIDSISKFLEDVREAADNEEGEEEEDTPTAEMKEEETPAADKIKGEETPVPEKEKLAGEAAPKDDADQNAGFVPPLPTEEASARNVILDHCLEEQPHVGFPSPCKTVVTVQEASPLSAVTQRSSVNSAVSSSPLSEATSKRLNLEDSTQPTTVGLSSEFQESSGRTVGGFVRPKTPEDEELSQANVIEASKEREGVVEAADGKTAKKKRRISSSSSFDENEDTVLGKRGKGGDGELIRLGQ